MRKIIAGVAAAAVAIALTPLIASALTLTPNYSWYTNTTGDEYTISNPAQYLGLVNIVNGTADGIEQDSFAGKTVTLSNDIDLWNNAVEPIGGGAYGYTFEGTLDGDGHQIYNGTIAASDGSTTNIGIVGKGSATSTVENLTIGSNLKITVSLSASAAQQIRNLGMVCGYTDGAIANCTNNGSISLTNEAVQTADLTFPIENVGGIAGIARDDITNCTNNGSITIYEPGSLYSDGEISFVVMSVGGITGCAGAEETSISGVTEMDNTHGTVSGCSNSGTIKIETPCEAGTDRFGNPTYSESGYIGGIAGYSRGDIVNCDNTGYIYADKGYGLGGIVGNLRALISSSTYSANFSSEGSDDGMVLDGAEIYVRGCTNDANIIGYVFPGGICGRAGTYTTITECVNTNPDTYVVGARPNKPFPAGIVGSTYGNVTYSANAATAASANWDFDEQKITLVKSGYYASGIAGNTIYFEDSAGSRISPKPEIYGCYNSGSVVAVDNMRQRLMVGDNSGYVHDCVCETGKGYFDEMFYTGEEASDGIFARCYVITNENMTQNTSFDTGDGTTTTALAVLNGSSDVIGWSTYWVPSQCGVNAGYPALNSQVTSEWVTTDITDATPTLLANAEYTGLVAVPSASATLGDTTLQQNVDFYVVPQEDASELSDEGTTPYEARIVGIGNYAGTAARTLAYGIGSGNMANCTAVIKMETFNWEPHTLTADMITVTNKGGMVVDPDEYTFEIDPTDSHLTDGQAINARNYNVIITAKDTSTGYYGQTTGTFTVEAASIMCSTENQEKYAHPTTVSYLGVEYDWDSMTIASDKKTEPKVTLPYTGHSIEPEVTSVVYLGRELTAGVDYRVTYGSTELMVGDATVEDPNVGEEGKLTKGYITVRYRENGNFRNYDNMHFYIDGTGETKLDITKAEVAPIDDIVFEEGSVYTPVTLSYGGVTLAEGTDYTIEYSGNDAPGTATYVITGIGLYEGTIEGSFNIVAGAAYTIEYTYDDASMTATVTGASYAGSLDSFDLEIPATVEADGKTYTVTAIADSAFGAKATSGIKDVAYKISSISLPATVETIGDYAFGTIATTTSKWLTNITAVTIADGSQLASIGAGAFGTTQIESITIPKGVATIGQKAFFQCTGLKSVTFLSEDASMPAFSGSGITLPFYKAASGVVAYGYDLGDSGSAYKYVTNTISNYPGSSTYKWTWSSLGDVPEPEPEPEPAATYTVTFDPANGEQSWTASVEEGATVDEPQDAPVREGYAFEGWFASTDGGQTLAEEAYDFTAPVNADLLLCAKWSENSPEPEPEPEPVVVTATAWSTPACTGNYAAFGLDIAPQDADVAAYQWQYRKTATSRWINSSAAGSATADEFSVKITDTNKAYEYRCLLTLSDGTEVESEPCALTVLPRMEATILTTPVSLGETAEFSVSAEFEISAYQWQYTKDGNKWINSNLACATEPVFSYKLSTKTSAYKFRCVVTAADGTVVESSETGFDAVLRVSIATTPVALGETATFTVAPQGFEAYSYQWQYRKTADGNWIDSSAASATSAAFTYKASEKTKAYEFRCVITDESGTEVASDACGFDLAVVLEVQISTNAVSVGEYATFTATPVDFEAASYQWQYSKNGSKWINSSAASATSPEFSYKLTDANGAYTFRCVVTAADGTVATSDSIGFEVKD